jgi:hypothetical protein
MNRIYYFLFIILLFGVRLWSEEAEMNMNMGELEFVHPFYTHMGLPDPVGHYDFRLTGIAFQKDGDYKGDGGFHLETTLVNKLGLHIRNDRIANNAHTEITLQYAALQNKDGMTGIAPFVELEVPSHKGEEHFYGLVGFSTMWTSEMLQMNQTLEYSPAESGLEASISVVGKIGKLFFPIGEFVTGTAKDVRAQNTVIGGMKFIITKNFTLGLGYQFPVTDLRDYDRQILLQIDIEL